MRNRNNHRPPARLGKSVSDRREGSEMWAKSVEKPKDPPCCRKRQSLCLVPRPTQSAEIQWQIAMGGSFRHQRNPISWDRCGSFHRVVKGAIARRWQPRS